MNDSQIITALASIIGSLIVALTSIVTTIIVQSKQLKEHSLQWNKDKVFDVCVGLLDRIINDIPVYHNTDLVPYLSQSEFKNNAEILNKYISENEGLFSLCLTEDIYNEVINFQFALYRIVSNDEEIIFHEEDLSDRSTLIGDLFARRCEIIKTLQNYLGINQKRRKIK